MPSDLTLGPTGTCVGITECPLIAVGPPSPEVHNIEDVPECIRKMFPRIITPADIIKAVWLHLKQCPLVRIHIVNSFAGVNDIDNTAITSSSSELIKVWNEIGGTKKRSDHWEATLTKENEQWNVLASKFVDLTRQTLLGAVKSLPVEFHQRDLVEFQDNLQSRRRNALELRDDLVRRTQRINKQHQMNEESRRMLLHYVTHEVNSKLEEAIETQNLIERHHYIARVTNKAKQDQMVKAPTLLTREVEQKNERMKILALDPDCHDLGMRRLQEEDLQEVNVSFVNKFDTKAVADRVGEQILERDRQKKLPVNEVPEEGTVAMDFFAGGFWLKKDKYRNPAFERDIDYSDRKWKMDVGERPTSDPRGSDRYSQWLNKAKKTPRKPSNAQRRIDPMIDYSRRKDNLDGVREEIAPYMNRPELGDGYATWDKSDFLPVADVIKREAERVEAEKMRIAKERAKAEKRKQRAEEKKRVPKSHSKKRFAPAFPTTWIVPAGPSAPPRQYKRVVDDLNTIDVCGALTGANFLDYRPQNAAKHADQYL